MRMLRMRMFQDAKRHSKPSAHWCTALLQAGGAWHVRHVQSAFRNDSLSACVRASGCAGLQPTVAAIKAGKDICLANKETLIAGGPYVLPLAAQYGVNILPADSEHSVRARAQGFL